MEGPLTLIMPVFNEAETIEKVIRDTYGEVSRWQTAVNFIIAEDGSQDGTKEILYELQKDIPFTLVSSQERKGYTRAFKDALALAGTPWVLFSDSDGQHDPRDMKKLVDAAEGYDIVSGCKTPRHDPPHRLMLSFFYNSFIHVLFGLKMKDCNSGFKLIRKSVIDQVLPQLQDMRDCIMSEFILRAYLLGFRIREIPVTHYARPFGQTAIFQLKQLPGIIWGLLKALVHIKREDQRRKAI